MYTRGTSGVPVRYRNWFMHSLYTIYGLVYGLYTMYGLVYMHCTWMPDANVHYRNPWRKCTPWKRLTHIHTVQEGKGHKHTRGKTDAHFSIWTPCAPILHGRQTQMYAIRTPGARVGCRNAWRPRVCNRTAGCTCAHYKNDWHIYPHVHFRNTWSTRTLQEYPIHTYT